MLSFGLSQLQDVQSAYNVLFLLFAKYNFLFENDFTETQSPKTKQTKNGSTLSTQDPARDGYNWYAYCSNNPLTCTDPDGLIAETAWDIASLSLGIVSLGYNIYHGNTKEAIFDGIGILADAAAVALPFIPGGVGAARKAVKATKIAAEAVGGTEAVLGEKKYFIINRKLYRKE